MAWFKYWSELEIANVDDLADRFDLRPRKVALWHTFGYRETGAAILSTLYNEIADA